MYPGMIGNGIYFIPFPKPIQDDVGAVTWFPKDSTPIPNEDEYVYFLVVIISLI